MSDQPLVAMIMTRSKTLERYFEARLNGASVSYHIYSGFASKKRANIGPGSASDLWVSRFGAPEKAVGLIVKA